MFNKLIRWIKNPLSALYVGFAGLGVLGIFGFVLLLFLAMIGWFFNLWKIVLLLLGGAQHFPAIPWMGELILRIVGIPVGYLGMILGWI